MSLLQEFAKKWLETCSDLSNVENLLLPDTRGLCSNFITYYRHNPVHPLELKYELFRCYGTFDIPFDSSFNDYRSDVNKHLNPKRRAFVEAIAQGKLVVDDFGNMVVVKETTE